MAASADVQSRRDVFISHASEDKEAIAQPLADELIRRGLSVWFDQYELVFGDSLREMIDSGLEGSRIGVVILSHDFFAKEWPQRELDGLHAKLIAGEKNAIVPIRHGLTADEVRRYSPLLAGRLSGNSEIGVDRLADEIERVLQRVALPNSTRPRRRKSARSAKPSADPSPSASAPAGARASDSARPSAPKRRKRNVGAPTETKATPKPQPSASAPTAITELDPEIAPQERPEVLAERVVAAIKDHPGECMMTVVAAGRLLVELVQRGDGAITIRSTRLRPQQRVLSAQARALLEQLTASVLKQLSAAELASVEILCTPETLSELPARMRASKAQVELVETLLATLKEGADHRSIALHEEQGTMSMTRSGETVELSVHADVLESPRRLLLSLGDPGLEEAVLAAVTDISTRRGFGNGHFTDSFPLRGVPSFSKLRMLAERLLAAEARFTLWQRRPVEREVLTARQSKSGAFVLERPGLVPSVEQFDVSEMVRLVEAFEDAVKALVETRDEPLQARANWLITEQL